ncbi:MAG: hydrogenase maturation protease [Planctomycetota bacterium]|jgi:hydrogenase maturation protease HycI
MENSQALLDILGGLRGSKTVILGVGNVLKGDDAAGPLVCEGLRSNVSATVIDAGTVPENYIRPVIRASPENLLIVDAVDSGDTPGTVRVFKPDEVGAFALSTHALSFHLFADMIRQEISVEILVLGIQPTHTKLGEAASAAVRAAIDAVTSTLREIFPVVE